MRRAPRFVVCVACEFDSKGALGARGIRERVCVCVRVRVHARVRVPVRVCV